MFTEEVELGIGTAVLPSELNGSVDLGVPRVGLILDQVLDEGVCLGMLLLLEAKPAPDEIKYSIVIGNDVFRIFRIKEEYLFPERF